MSHPNNIGCNPPEDNKVVSVGIGGLAIVQGNEKAMIASLGSCVGLVIYDEARNIGGVAHIMLPAAPANRRRDTKAELPGKYADEAIVHLIKELKKRGGVNLKAKIFGGANMFPKLLTNPEMNVGERNIISVKNLLQAHRVPIVAEDVGGNLGRTIIFSAGTGKVEVKTLVYRRTVK